MSLPVNDTTLEGKCVYIPLNDLTTKVTSWCAKTTKQIRPLPEPTWPILTGSGQVGQQSIDFGKLFREVRSY